MTDPYVIAALLFLLSGIAPMLWACFVAPRRKRISSATDLRVACAPRPGELKQPRPHDYYREQLDRRSEYFRRQAEDRRRRHLEEREAAWKAGTPL